MLTTAHLKTLLFTRLRRFLVHAACFKRILEATQNHGRCRDDFVWKGIYCKPSCSEIRKRPDHELLVCRWTQCHPSLWNMQCLYVFNESLWDLIIAPSPYCDFINHAALASKVCPFASNVYWSSKTNENWRLNPLFSDLPCCCLLCIGEKSTQFVIQVTK